MMKMWCQLYWVSYFLVDKFGQIYKKFVKVTGFSSKQIVNTIAVRFLAEVDMPKIANMLYIIH